MAEQSNVKWHFEFVPPKATLGNGSGFNFQHSVDPEDLKSFPSFASLVADLAAFKFKEPQMQGTPAQPETEASEPQSPQSPEQSAIDAYEAKVSALSNALVNLLDDTTPIDLAEKNAELQSRVDSQRASIKNYQVQIEEYQGRILELEQNTDDSEFTPTAESQIGRIVNLQNQLQRALHTQKILERDLEEAQQGITAEKVAPKIVRLGYGERLVYPCQDTENDNAWGLVLDPDTSLDDVESVVRKPVVLTDGDVFLQFKTSNDVARFICSLGELRNLLAEEETYVDPEA